MPQVAYQTNMVGLPGISLGLTPVPNPSLDYSVPGSKLQFHPLTINFLIDEDLSNYKEVYNWMMEMRSPEDHTQADVLSDCTLTILSNQKNPIAHITFVDTFPIELADLQFDFRAPETQFSSVTLEYKYFKFD